MNEKQARNAMWARVRVLFRGCYGDRESISLEFARLLEARLAHHPNEAMECAAALLLERHEHPPTLKHWIDVLEGAKRREPVHRTDVWNRKILGTDGAPIIAGWTEVRGEADAYVELARREGKVLPAARPTYVPPRELDRPESDGEPRPALPQALINRALPPRPRDR